MNIRKFFALLVAIPCAVLGKWTPPRWLASMVGGVRRCVAQRPRTFAAVMAVVAAGAFGGWKYWLWFEAHRPRVRELSVVRSVSAKVVAPKLEVDKKTRMPVATPVVVEFSGDAAPLDAVGKADVAGPGVFDPPMAGSWVWVDGKRARFTPVVPWPAGTAFRVDLALERIAILTRLTTRRVEFTTERVTARWFGEKFDTAADDPMRHHAVASVAFNQPVSIETVRAQVAVTATGGGGIFKDGGAVEVLADSQSPLVFHVRSPRIAVPAEEDFVNVELKPGTRAVAGGVATEFAQTTKIKVPTRTSGFRIAKVHAQLVKNEDGEPRQVLFVETTSPASPAVIAKALQCVVLPERDDAWTVSAVNDEVRASAKALKLEHVEEDDAPKHAKTFAFRVPPMPATALLAKVPKGVESLGGFELGMDYEAVVEVPAFPKEAGIVGEGGVLALNGERKLSVKSRGYDHLRYTLGRVPAGQINHLVSQTGGQFQAPEFRGRFGQENVSRVHRRTLPIAKRNDFEASYSAFDFAAMLATADASDPEPSRGLYFMEIEGVRKHTPEDGEVDADDPDPDWIVVNGSGEDVDFDDEEDNGAADRRFLLVTDLGLLVKRNADGTRDVFVQSFKDRDPVNGVRITALAKNGESLAESTTDAEGHAALPALDGLKRERTPVAIVARRGTDLAFIPWNRSDRELELSRFDVEGVKESEATALDAFLFTERGVYRPGDAVRVAAIVRQRNWAGSMDGIPVELRVRNAKEEKAGTFAARLNAHGFIDFEAPTAETAPTGVWRAELHRAAPPKKKKNREEEGEDEETTFLGHVAFRVEDFQPDRMKMLAHIEPATQAGWMSPDALAAKVEVQTLFGIAAAERRVTAAMRIDSAVPYFDQWPKWRFHLPREKFFETKNVELTEQKSDAAGAAKFPLPLASYDAPLLRVNVDLEAFEPDGGRGVRASLPLLVSARKELMGVKTDGELDFIGRDVPVKVRLVAINSALQPVALPGLKRVLIESRHVSVLTKQDNGTLAYVSRQKDKELETVAADLPQGESELALPTATAGRFRYEWRDAAGTPLCVLNFVVVGPGEGNRNLERDSELEVTMPAKELRPGEDLAVSLRAPYQGGGLITIEREKVLGWKWFKADSAASLQQLKLPEALEGSAYVNVAWVRGLDSPEIFTNPLSVGVAPFRVEPEKRKLEVALDVPQRIQPGEVLRIGYRSAKPSRVVVWAVDEGIHRVTNYHAPEPLALFFRQRSLEVGTWQLMDLLLPEYSMLKQSKAFGGDGDSVELNMGLNPFKRRKAAPVVFWSGIVESGPERREVTYAVPDYFAGRLNIMAAAVAIDSVGTAQQQTIVKGPFVLTPNAPFFAAPGDEFVASLTVANQTEGADAASSVVVSAETQGGIEILDAPKLDVAIAPNTESTVRFRVRAKTALGNAEIKFTASAGTQRVEVRSTLSVRPVSQYTTKIQSGWFRRDSHEVPAGRAMLAEFSKREATASTTPLGLNRGLESYLDQYPHGCSEQITSRAFPWLAAQDREKARAAVAHAIGQLARRQGPDGGFGYWTSGEVAPGFDYVSVYVAHFLTEAKAAGFDIPASVMDGTLGRLKVMAGVAKIDSRHDADVQAAAIYLLTRHGVVTTNYALNLRDSLERLAKESWHTDTAAAWLAATFRLLKKDDEAKKLIAAHWKAVRASVRTDDDSYFYQSALTRNAQSFTAICRHFPEVAGTFGYDDLRIITEPIQEGRFHTLGAAWSVLALRAYAGLVSDAGIKVAINELAANAVVAAEGPGVVGGRFSQSATSLRFSLRRPDGAPDLGAWFQVVEAGYDQAPPLIAETKGLEVVRELVDAAGTKPGVIKVGDTLRMRVRVRNVSAKPQSHLAVIDLFPSGFDLAPDGLKPGLRAIAGAEYVDVREDRATFFTSLAAGESRTFEYPIRPTCAGTFAMPPAFAENMYDRAIHGAGVTGTVTVNSRE